MRIIILILLVICSLSAQEEVWIRTGQGKVKLKGSTLSGYGCQITTLTTAKHNIRVSRISLQQK